MFFRRGVQLRLASCQDTVREVFASSAVRGRRTGALLLVDEASLGLSPALTQTVFSVVDRINNDGVTVVLVEQNVGVLPYADRALIMEKGTLVYQGSGDEIHSGSLRETYLGTPA